jgi:hypothetical protein
METAQFYCVGCQELKDAASGHRVFRTGYFRLVYPLGCCLHCAGGGSPRSAAAADCPSTVFGPLDASPQPATAPLPPDPSDLEVTEARPAAI